MGISDSDRSRRISVLKTYKLFIGGKFPRTESGRTLLATAPRGSVPLAHYCRASRKDLRDAVRAARKAQPGWQAASPYLKGQILYRVAEMLESRATALSAEIARSTGITAAKARAETEASIDRLVHFAGWTDKLHQVFGSVNPVASSHFNFTTPEPTGVVGIVCPDRPSFLPLVSMIASTILSGNTAVVLASERHPLPSIALAEALATSDVPGGVVNLLTGTRDELVPQFATHMDLNAVIDGSGDESVREKLRSGTAVNLKRIASHALSPAAWSTPAAVLEDPYRILDTIEYKTAWHPIGV